MRARYPQRMRATLAMLVLLGACGDGITDPPPGEGTALVIAPGALLFAGSGETQQLRAFAVDGDGDSTEVAATFSTSDPAIVSVTPGGLATGGASLGSAQIVAQSGDLVSAPVLALRATPAAGALLVADSQVIGAIVPVSASAAYAPGWQYRVRLRGASPQVGQVVLAAGGAPVGGRVVSVAGAGSDVEVVLELLALNEMFTELTVSQRLSLEDAELVVSEALSSSFRIGRSADGDIRLDARNGQARLTASAARPSGNSSPIEQEFDLGPFDCKAEVPQLLNFPLTLDVFSFELDPSLWLDLEIDGASLQRFVVEGGIAPTLSASPRITAALEAKAECKVQVATIILPIGGPLALIVGGQVPLGVGFEVGAKASFGQLGFDAFLTTAVDAAFGIDCATGCAVVAEIENEAPDGFFKPVLPSLANDVRFELGASAFGWATLTIGNQFLQALQFKAVEMKAGLEQKFELASPGMQASDPTYASSYSLKPVLEAKAAASLAPLEDLLQISIASLSYAPELPTISQSPRGTFAITPASVAAGDGSQLGEEATFTVTLTDAAYLGAYAVEAVQIRWRRTTGAVVTLESGRPGCTDLEATQDQLTFTCQTDFLAEHSGAQTFHAFVKTRIWGVPIPVPLEVGPDASATVTVTGGAISITPSTATLSPGGVQEFTAVVAGEGASAVTWTATGGTIDAAGNTVEYTAGTVPGTYTVTATSITTPTLSTSAAVTIGAAGSGSAVLTHAGGFAQAFVEFPNGVPCTDTDEASEQENFTLSKSFDAQCSGSWSSPSGEPAGALNASAASDVSYQMTLDGTSLRAVTAAGSATASATAQGEVGTRYRAKGTGYSSDAWFYFEVEGTVTVTLSGSVTRSGSEFESPIAFVDLYRDDTGSIFYTQNGNIAVTLTLTEGSYYLRGDAYAEAAAVSDSRPSAQATSSFNVTMTVGP